MPANFIVSARPEDAPKIQSAFSHLGLSPIFPGTWSIVASTAEAGAAAESLKCSVLLSAWSASNAIIVALEPNVSQQLKALGADVATAVMGVPVQFES